jgi:L-asparagine permease
MFFDKVQGPYLLAATVIGIPALIGGWFLVRHRVKAAAQETAVPATPPTDPSVAA